MSAMTTATSALIALRTGESSSGSGRRTARGHVFLLGCDETAETLTMRAGVRVSRFGFRARRRAWRVTGIARVTQADMVSLTNADPVGWGVTTPLEWCGNINPRQNQLAKVEETWPFQNFLLQTISTTDGSHSQLQRLPSTSSSAVSLVSSSLWPLLRFARSFCRPRRASAPSSRARHCRPLRASRQARRRCHPSP